MPQIDRDARAFVEALGAEEHVRGDSKFGVAGYCFTGALAMRFAAACPECFLQVFLTKRLACSHCNGSSTINQRIQLCGTVAGGHRCPGLYREIGAPLAQ